MSALSAMYDVSRTAAMSSALPSLVQTHRKICQLIPTLSLRPNKHKSRRLESPSMLRMHNRHDMSRQQVSRLAVRTVWRNRQDQPAPQYSFAILCSTLEAENSQRREMIRPNPNTSNTEILQRGNIATPASVSLGASVSDHLEHIIITSRVRITAIRNKMYGIYRHTTN